jgi:hypothetical protein
MYLIAILKTICIQQFSALCLNILHWSGWMFACRDTPVKQTQASGLSNEAYTYAQKNVHVEATLYFLSVIC